ncbi:hypothetical protein [Pseudomonas sp. NFACC45]|uniref:hypothetical protein n=1 Tax=Pseudomonas sp. NFACC45 TaxID=1566201 RepID=UPI0008E2CC52|nr:hypothetical protein [Pseudomonas sp. NFACC45]SFH13655.1 hypothetical protein SAMN03159297_03292 [Pseudomonas sp. NFACC45]
MKVFWWIVATIAAVPITKRVETQMNLSMFSPAIDGLWSWLTTLGAWLSRDVSIPVWFLLLLLVTTLLTILMLILIYARYEPDAEEDVKSHPLSNEQMQVFLCVGSSVNRGENLTFSDLLEHTRLPRITTHHALDVLGGYQLITGATDTMGYEYINLTHRGREFYLDQMREASTSGQ